jgi:hypothetical protein
LLRISHWSAFELHRPNGERTEAWILLCFARVGQGPRSMIEPQCSIGNDPL